jgi:hypothetical protein
VRVNNASDWLFALEAAIALIRGRCRRLCSAGEKLAADHALSSFFSMMLSSALSITLYQRWPFSNVGPCPFQRSQGSEQ